MSESILIEPEVQKAVDDYNRQERKRLYKIVCWFAIIGMPAGFSLDMQVYPHLVPYFLKLRLISSLIVGVFLIIYYRPWAARFDRTLFILMLMVPQGGISWMIYASEGAVSPYYAGLNLVLLAFCVILPWTYQETLIFSLITFAMYIAACLAHGPIQNGGIFFSNLYFLSITVTFAVVGSYFTSKLRSRETMLRFELDQNRKQLEESNRKLIELDQMKSRFFANISHELRTPLTLIISPLEELRQHPGLDAAARETLQLMQGNAMRLLKLINDLLDLVKLESGRMEIKKEPLVMENFIKGLTQSIQSTAKDKRVHLTSSVSRELGVILADRDKLEKILLNLLFNAVKFTPAGGQIKLTAETDQSFLVLKVQDTGMGISEENVLHIFDRFWQADSSAQRKYQGTGIGLSLVKELAEAQGGSVAVESTVGKGTTMTVRVALEKTSEIPQPVEAISGNGNEPTTESNEWLTKLYRRAELFPSITSVTETIRPEDFSKNRRPRVLVADDEPDMLRFLKSNLQKEYEVLEAVDGNQAIQKARQFLPDLMVLDMMMPEKDGIEACRELKNMTSTQAIPIILLTARADDETKMAALSAGANDFLTKPFSTTELNVRVKNLVESHQYQREVTRQKSALESALEQLKETEGQLVQNEKMASLGRLSAGIIHEINNPLNYALQAVHLLKMKKEKMPEEDRPKYEETLADISDGMNRVQRIISDLRGFSHPHSSGKDWVELAEVVAFARRFLSSELKEGIELEIKMPAAQVRADKNKLIQVFVNLIQNSADALKDKKFTGDEKPHILVEGRLEGDRVKTIVRDNGSGIKHDDLNKIFDPFFTTKDVGQGMGLGLSVCYRILHEQGGTISVNSEPGKFTEFVLDLPTRD